MSLLSMWGASGEEESSGEHRALSPRSAHARALATAAHARAFAAQHAAAAAHQAAARLQPLDFAALFSYIYSGPPLQPPRPPPGLIRPIPSRARPVFMSIDTSPSEHEPLARPPPTYGVPPAPASDSSLEVNVTEDDDAIDDLLLKSPSVQTDIQETHRRTNADNENRDPSKRDAAAAAVAVGRSPKANEAQGAAAVVDVACCDGPVRFRRVLNDAYDAVAAAADAAAAATAAHDDCCVEVAEESHSETDRAKNEGPFSCAHCDHAFKSAYCYKKHANRHLNPVVGGRRSPRPLDMNVQYYPCKSCGSKFPSYYFVHKHRKMCHPDEECGSSSAQTDAPAIAPTGKRKCKRTVTTQHPQEAAPRPSSTATDLNSCMPCVHIT